MTVLDAVKGIRGPKGTQVTLTLERDGFREPFDLTLIRDIIQVLSVAIQEIEPGMGYLRIRQFQERTAQDLATGLDRLAKSGRLTGVILDLRNNPGGLLSSAVEVSEIVVSTNESNRWFYRSGSESRVAGPYSLQWTHLRLVIDTARSTYTLWIDERLVARDVPAGGDPSGGIDSIGLHSGRGGIGHASYVEALTLAVPRGRASE